MKQFSLLEVCKLLNVSKFKLRYHLDFGNIKAPEKVGPHFRFSEHDVKQIAALFKIPEDAIQFETLETK